MDTTVKQQLIAMKDEMKQALDEIESLRRRLQDGSPVVEATIQHMAMEIAALKKERDGLVADAKRYGLIRKCLPFSTLKNITKEYLKNVPNDDVNAQLDAAIDAALAKLGAEKTGEK